MITCVITFLAICFVLLIVGLYSYHKISICRAALVLISFALCMFAVPITLYLLKPMYSYSVSIEATEDKNVDAQGYDVGIMSVKCGAKQLDLNTSDISSTWLKGDGRLSWGYTSNKTAEFLAPCYADTEIVFQKNIWAGIIQITARGVTEKIDLYALDETTETYHIGREQFPVLCRKMTPIAAIIALELAAIWGVGFVFLAHRLKYVFADQNAEKKAIKDATEFLWEKRVLIVRILIVVVSFIIMLIFAGQVSLWADDLATIEFVAKGLPLEAIVNNLKYEARYNPPLFYIVAYFWLRMVPYGTVYLKLINIIFSCLGIWFCGVAAKRIQGERASVIATIFAGTSVFLVKYAAYTFRCFGLAFMLCALLVIAYHKRLTEPKSKSSHALYALVHILLLYTCYICVLITAVMGMCDCYLLARKKVKPNILISYTAVGAAFLPYFLYVLSAIVESHSEFWPETPNMKSLFDVIGLISGQNYILFLFCIATPIALYNLGKYRHTQNERSESLNSGIIIALVLWTVFLVGFDYIFSRYINPSGSIFVARYFIATLAPAMIVAAVCLDWILTPLCVVKGRGYSSILTITIVSACLYLGLQQEIVSLSEYPGAGYEPYEQAIDWIYNYIGENTENTLVIMTGYQGGLYYYGTHDGQRENLNFGSLNSSNWQSFDEVYVSPMHGLLAQEETQILDEHFEEVRRNDSLNVVAYRKK